jgi:hypothetical protein
MKRRIRIFLGIEQLTLKELIAKHNKPVYAPIQQKRNPIGLFRCMEKIG